MAESEVRMGEYLASALKENAALRAENERLRATLKRARDDMEAWGGYASEYFREKHDLNGDLAAIDAVLTDLDGGTDDTR